MSKKFQLKISQALDKLGKLDKDIKEAVKFYGYPEERKMPVSEWTAPVVMLVFEYMARWVAMGGILMGLWRLGAARARSQE